MKLKRCAYRVVWTVLGAVRIPVIAGSLLLAILFDVMTSADSKVDDWSKRKVRAKPDGS